MKPLVILVDDEAFILSSSARVLRGLPVELSTWSSPEAALDMVAGSEPALVISDYRMPGMSGSDFLSRVARLQPGCRRALASGSADFDGLADAVNRGAITRFIAKPVEPSGLREIVADEVSRWMVERLGRNLPDFISTATLMGAETDFADAFARFMASSLDFAENGIRWGLAGSAPDLPDADPGPGTAVFRDGRHFLELELSDEQLLLHSGEDSRSRLRSAIALCARTALIVRGDIARKAELERMSMTDSLSGLPNRRAFDEALAFEFGRSKRYGSPLSLLLVDIDKFKEINDRLGHQAGDAVIRLVGSAIASEVRASDCPARFGGDEFAIALPSVDGAGAIVAARRIMDAVGRGRVEAGERQFGEGGAGSGPVVSLSIGISVLDEKVGDANGLFALADAALYRAKENGRGRVEIDGKRSEGEA